MKLAATTKLSLRYLCLVFPLICNNLCAQEVPSGLEELSCKDFYSLVVPSQEHPTDYHFLAVDAGGTKTQVVVYRNGLECIGKKTYYNADFDCFEDVLEAVLQELRDSSIDQVDAIGVGLAGAIEGKEPGEQSCRLTNVARWPKIDSKTIASKFAVDPSRVLLMNDLEATGFGVPCLSSDDFITLNEGVAQKGRSLAIIAPGTGLGNAALHYNGQEYLPYPSEGGHMNFFPGNEEECNLLRYLQEKRNSSYVSIETVVSGPGICTLYQYLLEHREENTGAIVKTWTCEDIAEKTKEIVNAGQGNEDPIAREALDWFVVLLAKTSSTSTLYFYATGGCYIAGGMGARLATFIEKSKPLFMEAFIDKGPYKQLLKDVPIKIVKNPHTAAIGAGYAAIRLHTQSQSKKS